ncbi:DegT/DnrJ/EryC1/StrS aminotransferase family protein [Carboxylicivirga sp. M1479]|uniref:DegT/DnrJ/EryC1/StrS family aminotransferase n=1 Tax=Carboxylicivirga sp. M1479 TaxID=2594476 RepID=UPI00117776FC|nr:DegT/DnrJ/EryC1/StrS family aminotransferase [Carboxylicivirga sp. M1479]TRX71994.1 DegT/DnrJ/EryC1/StrS family aminotransferase [Carboxylicivirga sp. M1479]
MDNKKVFVTQPALPDLEDFIPYIEQIWNNNILTNNGPFHQKLEEELAKYLNVPYVSLFANGTLALLTALQVLRITGEVITTPYSFVATSHCLLWNQLTPVFVDIEKNFCNIDAEKIEEAITPKTSAILPVHVYGNPCAVERIQEISDTYGLKTIYDAAHAFGVNYKDTSILNYGDLSILSFHATKVYNTIEGGAIISHDLATKKRIDYLKNFGFAGETKVVAPGINSKMNELQAAYGLLQLKNHEHNVTERKRVADTYQKLLEEIDGIRLLSEQEQTIGNYAYFPIFVNGNDYGSTRDQLYEKLKKHNIYGRRYFYPLISEFPMYKGYDSAKTHNLPNATKIAEQVICLPIYPTLEQAEIERICYIIKK